MASFKQASGSFLKNTFVLASSTGLLYMTLNNTNFDDKNKYLNQIRRMYTLLSTNNTFLQTFMLNNQFKNECWASDETKKYLQSINTNVYVWGEGQQVEAKQDYSNFTPKNIKNFRGKNKPNVMDVCFGWYHEAYIDTKGKLYVCQKNKQSSVKIKEIDDKNREDLIEIQLPGNPKVRQAQFTRQRMFVLTEKGEVYVFKIEEKLPEYDLFDHLGKAKSKVEGKLHHDSPILVKDLPPIKQMATGTDHFLALTHDGKVFAMGDDTFGQCGQGGDNRSTTAPFFEKRFGKPVQIKLNEKVVKVAAGYRHSLAVTDQGNCYGWGYNNQLQLSHGEEYSFDENPWHAIFQPVLIRNSLEGKFVLDAAGGEEFSLFLCRDPNNGNVEEIYSCGNNLRGQLGINRVSHLQDMMLVEDVSGFVDQQTGKPLHITNIQCGRKHSIITFEYGAFFIWGDNEFGQLGNKKRSFLESPYPKSKFEKEHNVENVICGIDSCAVIVEYLEDVMPKKKKKKQQKRTISQNQMITNPEQLKILSEQQIVKKKDSEDGEFVQKNLGERIRSKWHNTIYGDKKSEENKETKQQDSVTDNSQQAKDNQNK